jgi:TolB-like protein/Tfp pilus assembly protein PilF
MKRCPACNRVETDDALVFCRADGTALLSDSSALSGEVGTAQLGSASAATEIETSILPHTTDAAMSRGTAPTTALPAQPAASTTQAISRPKRSKAVIMGVALMLAAIAVGGYFYHTGKSRPAIESIAVMPFVNESGNADVEYLADGMTETLINSLSQIPNLSVKARSSVFRYKAKEIDPKKIGSELNVQAILMGRVVQRGEQLTLSLELIDAQTENTLWGNKYERKSSDLVALQSEMARDVSSKLKTKLSGADEAKVTKNYTANPEAYQLYLRGRYHYAKLTKEEMQRGIEYFQQAIKLDPNFAMAYVGIADSYNAIPSFNYLSPREANPQAKAAALQALEIDPTLAEAHTALATSITEYDWDWEKSEREFKRALELNPNAASTHFLYGLIYLLPMGRTAEAIGEIQRSVELEPLNVDMGANLAAAYMYARQNERALEQARKTYDLEPNFVGGRIWLATVYDANGMYEQAIELCEKSLRDDPANPPFLTLAGYAYAKAGQRQKAEEIIKRWKEIAKTQYVSHYWIAPIYAVLGERDHAFEELEKAYLERDYFMPRLKIDPFMDSLRDDPRFKDLAQRIGLPELK